MNNLAFPAQYYDFQPVTGEQVVRDQAFGLTKRELFAAMAMQACRSRDSSYGSWADLARDSVEIADALLVELSKS